MIDNQENILVVDDKPDNLRLLSSILTGRGYKVRKALNGQTALNTVRTLPPDLILLDINMPGMNGYEVCQALKADDRTQEIPVIFISALDDVLNKVKAFDVGAVDYISKPFQEREVLARVKSQLIIRRQQQQLQQEIGERQKAEESLRVYLHTVSHDLRNPVLGMSMVLNNLLKQTENARPQVLEIPIGVLERMRTSCDRQLKLINSLVETQQMELLGMSLQLETLLFSQAIEQFQAEWQPISNKHQVTLIAEIATDLPEVKADYHQLWRVMENLVGNAISHNPPGIEVKITAELIDLETGTISPNQAIRCTIADNGIGIEPEQIERLFERYQRGDSAKRTVGLGLGLYLCRQIIEAHGGKIGAIASPDKGSQFWFTLPIPPKSSSLDLQS